MDHPVLMFGGDGQGKSSPELEAPAIGRRITFLGQRVKLFFFSGELQSTEGTSGRFGLNIPSTNSFMNSQDARRDSRPCFHTLTSRILSWGSHIRFSRDLLKHTGPARTCGPRRS